MAKPCCRVDPQPSQADVLKALDAARAAHAICDLVCGRCGRFLCAITRRTTAMRFQRHMRSVRRWRVADWCRWCGRPISETGEAESALEGFLAAVRSTLWRW